MSRAAIMVAALSASGGMTGITVQACGDLHVEDLGLFATAERNLVFENTILMRLCRVHGNGT